MTGCHGWALIPESASTLLPSKLPLCLDSKTGDRDRLLKPDLVLQFSNMSQTWTIRPKVKHEQMRRRLKTTHTKLCHEALDFFCEQAVARKKRLDALRGSLHVGGNLSFKKGFER